MLITDLNVNYQAIKLGDTACSDLLVSGKFRKLGFLSGLLLRKPKGTIIYWAKNCHIDCFNIMIALIPRLKPSDGPFMFGTSAFLYTSNGIIYKVVYQLLNNKDIAPYEFNNFINRCTDINGIPHHKDEELGIWEDEEEAIICELSKNHKNHFVYWLLKKPKDNQ